MQSLNVYHTSYILLVCADLFELGKLMNEKKDLAEIEEKQKSLEKKHAQELRSALDDLEAAQEAHETEMAFFT